MSRVTRASTNHKKRKHRQLEDEQRTKTGIHRKESPKSSRNTSSCLKLIITETQIAVSERHLGN